MSLFLSLVLTVLLGKAQANVELKVGYVNYHELFLVKDGVFEGLNAKYSNCIFSSLKPSFISYPTSGRAVVELELKNLDALIYMHPTAKRDRIAQHSPNDWGLYRVNMYSLKSGESQDKGTVGIRSGSSMKELAASLQIRNLVQIPTPSQLEKMLRYGRIEYYLEAEAIFSKLMTESGSDPNLYKSKSVYEIEVGTYFHRDFLARNKGFLKHWRESILPSCAKFKR